MLIYKGNFDKSQKLFIMVLCVKNKLTRDNPYEFWLLVANDWPSVFVIVFKPTDWSGLIRFCFLSRLARFF